MDPGCKHMDISWWPFPCVWVSMCVCMEHTQINLCTVTVRDALIPIHYWFVCVFCFYCVLCAVCVQNMCRVPGRTVAANRDPKLNYYWILSQYWLRQLSRISVTTELICSTPCLQFQLLCYFIVDFHFLFAQNIYKEF